jgi:D-lactate dehydrogenase (cytochrome)
MEFLKDLQELLPSDRISTNETVLEQHSKDESHHAPSIPLVVVFHLHVEEISKVMKVALHDR